MNSVWVLVFEDDYDEDRALFYSSAEKAMELNPGNWKPEENDQYEYFCKTSNGRYYLWEFELDSSITEATKLLKAGSYSGRGGLTVEEA